MIYKHRNIIVLGEDNSKNITVSLDVEKIAKYSLSNVNIHHHNDYPGEIIPPPEYPPSDPTNNWSIAWKEGVEIHYVDMIYDYYNDKWILDFAAETTGIFFRSPKVDDNKYYEQSPIGAEGELEEGTTYPILLVKGDNYHVEITPDYNNLTYTISPNERPGNIYLVGSFNNWNNTNDPLINPIPTKANNLFNGTYEFYQNFTGSTPIEFKWITTIGSWDHFYGDSLGENNQGTIVENGGGNGKLDTPGYYKITFDIDQKLWYSELIEEEVDNIYDQPINYDEVNMSLIIGTAKSIPPIINGEVPIPPSLYTRGGVEYDRVFINTEYLKSLLIDNTLDRSLFAIISYPNKNNDNIGVSSPIFLGEVYTLNEIENDLIDIKPTELVPAKDMRINQVTQIIKYPYDEERNVIYNNSEYIENFNEIKASVRKDIKDDLGNISSSFIYINNIDCEELNLMLGEAIILTPEYKDVIMDITSLSDPDNNSCSLIITISNVKQTGIIKLKLI